MKNLNKSKTIPNKQGRKVLERKTLAPDTLTRKKTGSRIQERAKGNTGRRLDDKRRATLERELTALVKGETGALNRPALATKYGVSQSTIRYHYMRIRADLSL